MSLGLIDWGRYFSSSGGYRKDSSPIQQCRQVNKILYIMVRFEIQPLEWTNRVKTGKLNCWADFFSLLQRHFRLSTRRVSSFEPLWQGGIPREFQNNYRVEYRTDVNWCIISRMLQTYVKHGAASGVAIGVVAYNNTVGLIFTAADVFSVKWFSVMYSDPSGAQYNREMSNMRRL